MQDHDGVTKIIFFKSIGKSNSNLVEIVAIKEALLIFASSRLCSQSRLWIESDSHNAVLWFDKPQKAPWRVRNLLVQTKQLKNLTSQCKVTHISREANEESDC